MQLADPLVKHLRLSPRQKSALKRLKIETVRDLLYHIPARYEETKDIRKAGGVTPGERVILYGKLVGLKTRKSFRSRTPIAEGYLEDGSGKLKVIWFNQPYLAKMIPEGSFVKATGRISGTPEKAYLGNPEIEKLDALPEGIDSLFADGAPKETTQNAETFIPLYPESVGVTSLWFQHAAQKILASGALEALEDPIPEAILKRYNLPSLKTALIWVHAPKKRSDAEAARKRFAFEEVFLIQLGKQEERRAYEAQKHFRIAVAPETVQSFVGRFPFPLTDAQRSAIDEIVEDLRSGRVMSRLLEGDVGSGKTAVAAATAYAVIETPPLENRFARLQVAYMAPTEILAKQQFESFISYFSHLGVSVGLLTGSGAKKFPSKMHPGEATDISRAQLLKWVESGDIPILVGTHALIQKTVKFKNLAYAVIDEQHRFGTFQRKSLVRKDGVAPHLLSMTATPIPRTLALTVYGDLDLSLLDELPPGRKPVITEAVSTEEKRKEMYEKIRAELADGRQAYVICPRIDEPDPTKEMALQAKSVTEEAKRLKRNIFPEYEVAVLHGKIKADERDELMKNFAEKKIDILVATSVVEVGVNVPNATVIIIEGAERFGLAQLHQLRGRVLRSSTQAYCFLLTETKGAMAKARLKAIVEAKNGFELAEFDLAARGAGDLYGRRQWGLSDAGMEALKNLKMVEAARAEARALVAEDPGLSKHPYLREAVERRTAELHFE